MSKSRPASLALQPADGCVGLRLETLRPFTRGETYSESQWLYKGSFKSFTAVFVQSFWCARLLHSHWPERITLGPKIWLVRPKQWQCESALAPLSFSSAEWHLSLFPPRCNFCGQVCIWQGAHQKQTKQTAFKQLWTNLCVVRTWSNLSQTQPLKELEFCCNFPTL